MNISQQRTEPAERSFDVVVVGAGFGGLYALHRLRERGLKVIVIEAGPSVGGTWYWNKYPGARCDVESLSYSYSFSDELQDEWLWTERFATQPEILRYIEHVADRFELRSDIRFDTRVESATFDPAKARWRVQIDRGGEGLSAQHLVLATGALSMPRIPDIQGLEDFEGQWFHTARWPEAGIALEGKRVALVGTGSSGIQVAPLIAEVADRLVVFQRTPQFTIPAGCRPLDADFLDEYKAQYPERRQQERASSSGVVYRLGPSTGVGLSAAEREAEFRRRWEEGGAGFLRSFGDLLTNEEVNTAAADFVRSMIDEIVADPAVAERLKPYDHPIGSKRLCFDSGYYATFNRPNVELVDLRERPIARVTPNAVELSDSYRHEVDVIVFATGFDAMTGSILSIDINVSGGHESLREKWADGPRTYLGLATAGFPNLFMLTGPGSPSTLTNMVMSIEQHVDWVVACLDHMAAHGYRTIEAERLAEDEWVKHVNDVAAETLYPRARSWYMGANVPGKPRVFMPYVGGADTYRARCEAVAAAGYEGFRLT